MVQKFLRLLLLDLFIRTSFRFFRKTILVYIIATIIFFANTTPSAHAFAPGPAAWMFGACSVISGAFLLGFGISYGVVPDDHSCDPNSNYNQLVTLSGWGAGSTFGCQSNNGTTVPALTSQNQVRPLLLIGTIISSVFTGIFITGTGAFYYCARTGCN
jgi:hypothetical protein